MFGVRVWSAQSGGWVRHHFVSLSYCWRRVQDIIWKNIRPEHAFCGPPAMA